MRKERKKDQRVATEKKKHDNPVVLRMIAKNFPLSQWEQYCETGNGHGFFSEKRPEYVAAEIFRQLSHPAAVEIVAREWDHLTADVRLLLGTKAAEGNASGNVKKGCQRLNELIGGKLLREDENNKITATVRNKTFVVNPAVAGALRKYQMDDPRFITRR